MRRPHPLIRTLYALCHAIQAVIAAALRTVLRGRTGDDRLRTRLNAIAFAISALTTRIDPARIGPRAFAPLRIRTRPPEPRLAPATRKPPRHPAPLLSARGLAARLAGLLAQLEATAAEFNIPLPTRLSRLAARAAALAGCDDLPRPTGPSMWTTYILEHWPGTPAPTPLETGSG